VLLHLLQEKYRGSENFLKIIFFTAPTKIVGEPKLNKILSQEFIKE